MNKLIIGFFLLFTTLLTQAGNITILINPAGSSVPKQFKVYLAQYLDGNTLVADSAMVNSLPYTNVLKVNSNVPGLCIVQVAGEVNKVEFIYNPAEDMVLVADYWQLRDGVGEVSNSPENEAYAKLISAKKQSDSRIEDMEMRFKNLYFFQPDFIRALKANEDTIETIIKQYNDSLQSIVKLYPQTYTATTLVPLSMLPLRSANTAAAGKYDTYLAYANQHYFDYVSEAGSNALNHYALEDKIILYLDRYTTKNTDGAQQGIDVIMNTLKNNEAIRTYAYNLLLKNFLGFKTETLVRYLITKHSDGCSVNLSIEDLKKLTKMQSLGVGGAVPEISLPDVAGKQQSLKYYLTKNKYTIVYFWISWCAHCQKETPKLQALFQQYKKNGLGVYAISLDETKTDWQTALQKYNTEWVNVCEQVPIKNSTYAPAFNVSTTPKVYIVDNTGKIVAKDVYGDKLANIISALLK